MVRTVTVGIDGSQESLAAAGWAADEALSRDHLLRLIHVRSYDTDPGARYVEPEERRRWAEDTLHSAVQHVRGTRPDVRMETAEVRGDPVEALVTAAGETDLLVLGSRGLGGVTGFIAGSVSLAVLARVSRPVVLVRALRPDENEPVGTAGAIVLGLDLPLASDDALAFAFGCAERYGCGLRVVHSWSLPPVYGPDTGGALPMLMEEVATERRRELEAALAPWVEKHPDVAVGRQCRQGRAAQDLVEAAREARLIVVGLRHRSSRLGAHVGPVVHSVLHHAAAPVAVVPHD
ncbi:universal stress protein [Streptomyces apocyni]|uniref:universal stress protein n=1 Tax=Streptomyces apocyni TaxID=2654677 RepID=UPI0012EA70DD|nr:universal stress protein [Streptomyces apocyni]